MSARIRIAQRIAAKLLPPRRAPHFVIGPAEDPYMRRWWLIPRNRVLNLYLHHIRHDDDDRALHDHPWPSLSLLLRGDINEIYVNQHGYQSFRMLRVGALVYRPARFAHRLCVGYGDAWTLFLTGPRIREWGFHCPKGWRRWQDFVASGKPGEIGRGCGEME